MRIYRFRGTYWFQDTLSYDDFRRLWRLMREKKVATKASGLNAEAIGEWVDALVEADVLPEIVEIVLKPYNGTIFHRTVNRWTAWRHGPVRVRDVIAASPDFANVVRDFFLINIAWLTSWVGMSGRLDGFPKGMSPAQMIAALTGSFSQFVGTISNVRTTREDVPPSK